MARRPEPWYWKARKAWYVQINGKQQRLHEDEDEAWSEYYILMAASSKLSDRDRRKMLVPDMVKAYLSAKSGLRPRSIESLEYHLGFMSFQFKTKKLSQVSARDIVDLLRGLNLSDSSKHGTFVSINGLFRWARDAGHLDANPLAAQSNPYAAGRRTRGMTNQEFEVVMGATKDPTFKRLVRFLRDTGCRPGELCILSAKHLHPVHPFATLKPSEHKTGRRTGRDRTIIFAASVAAELRALALENPEGPILRNRQGRPFLVDTVSHRFAAIRQRTGLPKEVIPYAARHTFLTRLLELGVPLPLAARIAGHAGVNTIQESYFHPEMSGMFDAVNLAARSTSAASPEGSSSVPSTDGEPRSRSSPGNPGEPAP